MQVLSISTDRNLFMPGSAVAKRNISYGGEIGKTGGLLHIIVFTKKSQGYKTTKISPNVIIYPTDSIFALKYLYDAIKIGKKIIKENKLDNKNTVVTSQDPFENGLIGYFIARSFGAPLHLQIHTDFLSKYYSASPLNRIRIIIAKFTLPKAAGIRVVSDRIVESIKNYGFRLNCEPKVLPIRVDIESLTPRPEMVEHLKQRFFASHPHWRFIVLMVSRLEKEKHVEIGIEAFAQCIQKFPNMGLIIVGDGSQKGALRDFARHLNVHQNIVFEGWSSEVSAYYDLAEAYMLTSSFEGYAMSLIESAIAQCPVITTNVGIASQFFKDSHNAFICEVGDVQCVTNSLYKLITDNRLRESFKKLSKDEVLASIPSQEEFTKQYVQLLKDCLLFASTVNVDEAVVFSDISND